MLLKNLRNLLQGTRLRSCRRRSRVRQQGPAAVAIESLEPKALLAAAMVADAVPGADGFSEIGELTPVGDKVFFRANDGVHGIELWVSDGTEAGTFLVKDIWSDSASSFPADLTAFGDELFFSADDGANGRELWKSDGTEVGTVLVRDVKPGADSGNVHDLIVNNSTLFFAADESSTGSELWSSNGTTNGTQIVLDLQAGAESSDPRLHVSIDGLLYFTTFRTERDANNETVIDQKLYSTDGTAVGTEVLRTWSGNQNVADTFGGQIAKVADTLYITERVSTASGSNARIVDVVGNTYVGPAYFEVYELIDLNGVLHVTAQEQAGGRFVLANLSEVISGIDQGNARDVEALGSNLLFVQLQAGSRMLAVTDGTATGTTTLSPAVNGSQIGEFTNVDGTLMFAASIGSSGPELWQSDGTAEGTFSFDTLSGSAGFDPQDLTNVNGTLFFTADDGVHGRELWMATPEPVGLAPVPSPSTNARPFFDWRGPTDAQTHVVWLKNADTGQLVYHLQDLPNSEYQQPTDLAAGNYELWARSRDANGNLTAWLGPQFFEITTELVRTPPTFNYDNGTFNWSPVGDAIGYHLWVRDLTAGQKLFDVDDLTGTAHTPDPAVPPGQYRVWMRTKYAEDSYSAWSTGLELQVSGTNDPAPPQFTFVDGQFTWSEVDDATGYELWVRDLTNNVILFNQTGLTGTSYTPDPILNPGRYRVWMRTEFTNNGRSKWSTGLELEIPREPVWITGGLMAGFDATPTVEWSPAPTAVSYEIYVRRFGESGATYRATDITGTGHTVGSELSDGRYHVWLRAHYADSTAGPWTMATVLEITGRPSITASGRLVSWLPYNGATRYEVWVDETDQNGNRIQSKVAYGPAVTGTSFELPENVGLGHYAVWVRAIRDDDGQVLRSPWSSRFDFEAEAPVRDVPQLLSPLVPTFEKRPEVTWTAVAGAETYDMIIRLNGSFWRQETGLVTAAWTPDVDLPAGSIDVYVRARFSGGETGAWSDFSPAFNVDGQPQILNVYSDGVGQSVGFDWTAVTGAARYNIWARYEHNGEIIVHEDVTTGTIWHWPENAVVGEYQFQIQAVTTDDETGAWSIRRAVAVSA